MNRVLILKDIEQNTLLEQRKLQETDNIRFEIVEDPPIIEEKEGYIGRYILVDGKLSVEYIKIEKTEKEKKIDESKDLLAKWLEENPMKSEIHNPAGEYYTVTQEKQAQLTQMLMLYSIAVQAGGTMQLTWNCTGGVCEEWTYEQLSTLSFQIAEYVLPRVKKQQQYEVQIKACETIEEVEAIEIEYDTI